MLSDILDIFCINTGYDKMDSNNPLNVNPVPLRYINIAAEDLFNSLEADAMMREVVLTAPANQRVSLPPFIGELRGMREYNWSTTIPLNQIGVPRYSSDTWKYRWRNWTLIGKQPLAQSIANAGLLTLSVTTVEATPVQVVITGSTLNSNAITETVTLNTTSVNTVNSFQTIRSINCLTTPRIYDITISDMNNIVLAVLYNNESKTSYIIIDVSEYSWLAQVGDGFTTLVETLYKAKFHKFFFLTDEFPGDVLPVEGYDYAIAYKSLALWFHNKEGKEQDAILFEAKAKQVCDNNIWNAERGQQLKIQHDKNPTYNMFKKFRSYLNWSRTTWHD